MGELAMRDLASSGVICSSRAVTAATELPVVLVGNPVRPTTPRVGGGGIETVANNRLVTYEDDGHTGYGDNSCVNRAVDEFRFAGQPPTPGERPVLDKGRISGRQQVEWKEVCEQSLTVLMPVDSWLCVGIKGASQFALVTCYRA